MFLVVALFVPPMKILPERERVLWWTVHGTLTFTRVMGRRSFTIPIRKNAELKLVMTGKKKGTKTCDERQNTEVKLVTRSKNAEMKISLHVERVRDRTRNFDGQLDILSKQIIQLRAVKLVARARLVAPLKQRNRTTVTTDGELTLQIL